MKYLIFLFVFLVACSNSPTGNVVEEQETQENEDVLALEAKIVQLESELAEQEKAVLDANDLRAAAQTELAQLRDEFETLQATVNQQKVVLKQMDNERLEAVNEAEGCTERIESLEQSNEKLQRMLDVCQEDLQ